MRMDRLSGKNIIVIGGSTGIGAASVTRLSNEGASVLVADIDTVTAQGQVDRVLSSGGQATFCPCDIDDQSSVEELFDFADSHFFGIDGVLVNAANTRLAVEDKSIVEVNMEIFDQTLHTNLRGHLLCGRYAVPRLVDNGGGSIAFMSSRAGLTSETTRIGYSVSKAGMFAISRHIAQTWGKAGVRSNVIAPGTVLTDAMAAAGKDHASQRLAAIHSPRLGSPEDIAAAAAYLMSEDAIYINGQILSVDGGATMR